MKVFGLNKREYILDLKKCSKPRDRCSVYHKMARVLLHEMFSGYNIYEEVKLPGSTDPSKKSVLYLDFFIPNGKVGVEVHGEQHFKFVPFFHKTKMQYLQAKARDVAKIQWCEINSFKLIELRWDDNIEYWREKIERSR